MIIEKNNLINKSNKSYSVKILSLFFNRKQISLRNKAKLIKKKIQLKNCSPQKLITYIMAYQNSIDITIETFKGLTKRASNVEARAIKVFDTFAQQFSMLDDLNTNLNISLSNNVQQNKPDISGFSESQSEALMEVSTILINFFSNSNQVEKKAAQAIEAIKKENLDSTRMVDDCLNDLCSNSRQIDSIKFSINDNKHNLPSKLSKYQKSISGIVSLKTKVKKSSEVTKLWDKIVKIRTDNSVFQRSNFVPGASRCMDKIFEDSKNSSDLLKKQFLLRKDIILSIINANESIIENCKDTSNQLVNAMNQIDFQTDFRNFIQANQIIRYDILPDEFKPLDFSHECFSEITKVSNVLSFQLYPYSMARVRKEFMPDLDQNEISVNKGKIVLLMEDLSLPWAFIQKPYTNEMGYVPSSFLEEIGKGIGVLLNEFIGPDELLNKGDYVAIESHDDPEKYKVHTISDNSFDVPANLIAKISEF